MLGVSICIKQYAKNVLESNKTITKHCSERLLNLEAKLVHRENNRWLKLQRKQKFCKQSINYDLYQNSSTDLKFYPKRRQKIFNADFTMEVKSPITKYSIVNQSKHPLTTTTDRSRSSSPNF